MWRTSGRENHQDNLFFVFFALFFMLPLFKLGALTTRRFWLARYFPSLTVDEWNKIKVEMLKLQSHCARDYFFFLCLSPFITIFFLDLCAFSLFLRLDFALSSSQFSTLPATTKSMTTKKKKLLTFRVTKSCHLLFYR